MKTHNLKLESKYFKAIKSGIKKFEIRKNDRDFKTGDFVFLEEIKGGKKTGNNLPLVRIKYVLHGGKYGLEEGYCIFSWVEVN